MHKLSLSHLEIVHSIVEQGSMTNAAQTLGLSQPALSHQLKELESRLGCSVFHRVNKKLVLTKVGEEVFNTAKTVLGKMSQLAAKVKRLNTNEAPSIRISTECYTCYHWLPDVMQKLQQMQANIDIDIVVEATNAPMQALTQGKIDLAIITRQSVPSPIISQSLVEDELTVAISNKHPLAAKTEISISDLANETLFIYDIPESRNFVLSHVLNGDKTRVAKLQKVQLTEAIIDLVSANLGISIMADWAIRPFLQKKNIKNVRLSGVQGRREWIVASLSELSDYEKTFVNALAETFNA